MNLLPSEIGKFLAELRGRGVSVWPDGDLLNIWPATKLKVAELERLRASKPAVLEYLRRRNEDLLPSDEVCCEWRLRYCNTQRHSHFGDSVLKTEHLRPPIILENPSAVGSHSGHGKEEDHGRIR